MNKQTPERWETIPKLYVSPDDAVLLGFSPHLVTRGEYFGLKAGPREFGFLDSSNRVFGVGDSPIVRIFVRAEFTTKQVFDRVEKVFKDQGLPVPDLIRDAILGG